MEEYVEISKLKRHRNKIGMVTSQQNKLTTSTQHTQHKYI